MKKIGLAVLAAVELAGLAYATLVTWLLSGWFLDDFFASQLEAGDWWRIAAYRVLEGVAVAGVVGLGLFVLNRAVARWAGLADSRLPQWTAVAAFAAIALASIWGALRFAIARPFI